MAPRRVSPPGEHRSLARKLPQGGARRVINLAVVMVRQGSVRHPAAVDGDQPAQSASACTLCLVRLPPYMEAHARPSRVSRPHRAPAARGRPPAGAQDRPRRDAGRRLRLAARRWLSRGDGPRGARPPEGRERLLRGGHGAAPGADRPDLRRAQGAPQGRRCLGPGQGRRLPLPVALREGRAVPPLVPRPGRPGGRRAVDPR